MTELNLARRWGSVTQSISNDYVEKATISLVREYLYKKGFKSSLKALNHEQGSFLGTHDRRVALAKELKLECLMRQNKSISCFSDNNNSEKPLQSMLEVLVKAFQSQSNLAKKSEETQTETAKESPAFHDISIQTELTPNVSSPTTSPLDSEEEQESLEDEVISMSKGHGRQDLKEEFQNAEEDVAQNPDISETGSKASVPKHLGKLTRGNSKVESDSSDSYLEPLSPPSVSKFQQGFDNQFHIKKSTRLKPKLSPNHSEEAKGGIRAASMGYNFLQSKQDALAQVCLTQAENQVRTEQRSSLEDLDNESDPVVGGQQKCFESDKIGKSFPEPVMELRDIEDEDFGLSESDNKQGSLLVIRNPGKCKAKIDATVTRLDLKVWRELKIAVMGPHGGLQEGWIGQGFNFDPRIPYGLVQKKGGPCGVLAVMQALVIRNLMFGSEFCDETLPTFELHQLLSKSGSSKSEVGLPSSSTASIVQNQYRSIVSKRSDALAGALVEILWRCGYSSKDGSSSEPQSKGHRVKLCLRGNEPGSEIIGIETLEELKEYVADNLYQFDCIGLVYSVVLSRGIDRIQEDMDFPNSPLLGQHGYCSQELVNLLLFGKCISNAFDNQVRLDDKVLQGIEAQSDIGLLSLFEHYGSCEVGSFLKSPKFPIWIVCSESHFSVLFSHDKSLTFSDKTLFYETNGFDLYYYDGLSRQDDIIWLTISFDGAKDQGGYLSLPNGFLHQTSTGKATSEVQDDNLIPPLEKCIRTKWKNSRVFWNGTEPIL